ncbi:LCP family protein [Nocardioides marmorisolisilvae]|uniref:LytR family transcriptional regulator n=1 Tax=Nocardioides marmorisolisilvae TaxID=1542737 RepID=A0A3N0DT93_9ACTN|nr:LCP family protein [Nocardioides marmorisolisilvae]RNL78623.1 LytR family transcriptional regulator [Nocardioides marmorisolisilvae]
MPDRPEDSPEYHWLYGLKHGSTPPADEVEETQVIPGRPDPRTHPAAPDLPPGGPRRIQPEPGTAPRKRRRFPYGKVVLLLVLAWIAYLVAVPTLAWKKVDKVNAFPAASTRPADQPGTTYLLVGSDSRAGLTAQQRRQLTTGGDVGQRTDTIMLLHIGSGKPLLLSIPRDSLVPIPGHGTTKINAAFAYGGAKLLIRTLEQDTGVKIDHYVEIGFGGFVNAVDAVNGITVCPTRRMFDRKAGLHIYAGCQHVNGITALAYARSRHSDPALGDISRAKHQREVVSAIGDKVKSPWSVLNPFRYSDLINAATDSLKVSDGTGVIDMAKFARAMTQVNGKSGLTCSMPIRDLAVHWDRDRALALMRRIKTDKTDHIPRNLCSPTGLPQ